MMVLRKFPKLILFFFIFGIVHCEDVMVGVDQDFIEDSFDLPTSQNPTIIDVDEDDVCPRFEFNSSNENSFFLRIGDGNPIDLIALFQYDTTEYLVDIDDRVLRGENSSTSTFELRYNPETSLYTMIVDYNCTADLETENCTNTNFNCSGPLF